MKIKDEEKKLTLEYTAKIGHLIWSIPSIHNVTGNLSRGIVLLESKPDKDSVTKLVGYSVSKNYELTPLMQDRLATMEFVWDQMLKASDHRILAIGGNRKLSEPQLRKALFENNLLGGKEYIKKHRGPDEPNNPQSERRMFFGLDDTLTIGKRHKGKKIKDIIDNNPGYIAWALRDIGENFLNVPARKYYNDRMRK